MGEKASPIDRRNFLKAGAGTVATVTGLTFASEATDSPIDYDSDDVIYGSHREDSEPYDPENLNQDIDGLFLENSSDYLGSPVEHLVNLRSRPQYRELIDEMAENDTPIYFGDVNLDADTHTFETGIMAGEAGIGAALASKAGLGDEFTEKDMLISGFAGYLLQPFAAYSMFIGSDEKHDYVEASNNIHPETFALTRGLRNSVTAYKQNSLNGNFGTVWGSLHRGFKQSLEKQNEELKKDIEGLDEVWETFVGNEETVSKAVKMQSEGDDWYVDDILEFDDLEQITI